MDDSIYQTLAECLDAIERGGQTPESCLEKFPEQREALAPLLALALEIRSSPDVAPRAAFQRDARARILGQIAGSKPVTFWDRLRFIGRGLNPQAERRPLMVWVLILSALATLLSGGAVLAADSAVPGSALYGIDRSLEDFRLQMLDDPRQRAEFQLRRASERLREAETLSRRADVRNFEIAMDDYNREISDVTRAIDTAPPADRSGLHEVLDRSLGEHEAQLRRVFANLAPERVRGEETATPDPAAQPILSFEPAAIRADGCVNPVRFSGTLQNRGTPREDYAAGVVLGYQVIQGASYVDSVMITPSTWETIPAGQSVSFRVEVALNQSWSTVTDGTPIEVRIFVAAESNRPEGHDALLTLAVPGPCQNPPAPTPRATPVADPTRPVTISPQRPECARGDRHPMAAALADRTQVPYEEIMRRYCAGFDLSMIELAYQTSRLAGVPVDEIFALIQTGMTWEEIWQSLGIQPERWPVITTPTTRNPG